MHISVTAEEGSRQPASASCRDVLGICQWFHYQDYEGVERAVAFLHELGVRHLRTGISWADYHRPGGPQWYAWLLKAFSQYEVLLSIWHTPPSLAEGGTCTSPPRRLQDFADFIDQVISEYGPLFTHLELWNEPNNQFKWDFARFDPDWAKFGAMVGMAAYWAGQRGVKTVLGGMMPVDQHWLDLMRRHRVLSLVDKVGIHGFPGMWWSGAPNWDWHRDWHGWAEKVGYIRAHSEGRPIWITETGLATWDLALQREAKWELQEEMLRAAAAAPAERVYWYSLLDLDPRRDAIEGFHADENEYHLGLVMFDGTRKHAFYTLKALLRGQLNPAAPAAAQAVSQ
jgi:CDP-paratose 2-epimerase